MLPAIWLVAVLASLLVLVTYHWVTWTWGAVLFLAYWPGLYLLDQHYTPDLPDYIVYSLYYGLVSLFTLLYLCVWCCCSSWSIPRHPVSAFALAVTAHLNFALAFLDTTHEGLRHNPAFVFFGFQAVAFLCTAYALVYRARHPPKLH